MIRMCQQCGVMLAPFSALQVDIVDTQKTVHFCDYVCVEQWVVDVRLEIENRRDSSDG